MDQPTPPVSSKAPGCGLLAAYWALLFPATVLMGWMILVQASNANPGRMRGAWVRTSLSEWGTGRGGYFLNEGEADRVIRNIYIGVAVLATVGVIGLRPRRLNAIHLGLAFLAGLWGALPAIHLWTHDHFTGRPTPPDLSQIRVPDPLPGHQGTVARVAFSPDGRLLVSAGRDKTLRVWNVATGQETAQRAIDVTCLAFAPDGATLATGESTGAIRLWKFPDLLEVGTMKGDAGPVATLEFSRDGGTLAAAPGDKTVRLWNLKTREETASLAGHDGAVTCVAFAPDGKFLASGGADSAVRIWDLATKSALRTIQGPGTFYGSVQSLAYSPDGRWFVGGSETSGVIAWETSTWVDPVHLDVGSPVPAVCFSPDGRTIAAGEGSNVRVWEVTGGGNWSPTLSGGAGRFVNGRAELLFRATCSFSCAGPVLAVAVSADGRTLASAGEEGPNGPRVMGGMRPRTMPVEPGALNLWDLR